VRKKGYQRDDLVERAMHLFRDHGFAGTSTQMLVDHLCVNRNSMYAEFGSKQALFDAVLERYDEHVFTRNFGSLEAPDAGLDQIRETLASFGAAAAGPASGRGCLLCNTAVEFGPADPTGRGFPGRYFERIAGAFRNALENAGRADTLRPTTDLAAESHALTATVLGLFVMIRARAPIAMIRDAVRNVIDHVESLRCT
jgi:TetR/AcrR family transcriptional regulator, transcriptional repressor for nem operon